MKTQTKFIIFVAVVVLLIGSFGVYYAFKPAPISKLDGFAQCINSSGAKFYGAFWCSHCKDQKDIFASSAKYLPYIECADKDNTQAQVCIDNKIEGYPTWTFKDESRLSGKLELATLAEKTQCILPK